MFTVKIMTRHERPDEVNGGEPLCWFSTKLVEAVEVDIRGLQPGELYEVSGTKSNGDFFSYYVSNSDLPKPEGFAEEVEFGYAAYIENSSGATTEAIKF